MYSYPSLKQRVFLCNKESTAFQITKGPRGTYRNYTTDGLSLALKGLEEGMSYRRVSEMYNIPCATLHDHVSGIVKFGARSGPEPYLNIEEEEELASFLIHTARIGFPYTHKKVFAIVGQILGARAVSASVTNGWWERYLQWHPQLTLKSAVSLGLARAKASDPEVFCRYFDMLFDCLTRNDILDKPECIFNCDETGLAFNPPCFKVVGRKGSTLCHVTSGDKSKATVLAFVGATGIANGYFRSQDLQLSAI